MSNSAKRDAREATINERRREALELRKAGASYEQIAKKLDYADKSNARRDIAEAIKDIIREPAEEVLALELGRLDAMFLGCFGKAKSGDAAAIDRAIRIMDRRAKYLGLDAPVETSVEVKSDSRERILNLLKVLAATGIGAGEVPGEPK